MAKSRFIPQRDNRFSVVDFDGSDDYITLDSDISLTGEFTFNFWLSTNTSGTSYLVSKSSPENWIRFDSASSNARLAIDGTSSSYITSLSIPSDGSWFHFSITRDSSNVITAYVDGVQDGNTITQSGTFTINEIGKFLSSEFAGQMGNVSVYNTAKSAEEVYAIYQQGITYDESSLSGLQGYWRMGDDTSKAYPYIADSSSNSNDGTITNGALDDIVQQMVAGYDLGAFESSSEELSAELALDGGFDTDVSAGSSSDDWALSSVTHEISNGRYRYTDSGTGILRLKRGGSNIVLTLNKLHKLTFEIFDNNAYIAFATDSEILIANATYPVGTNTVYFIPTASHSDFDIKPHSSSSSFSMDNLSLKEVLQSEVSDTYPFIADVNEPVLGAELVQDSDWTEGAGWADTGDNTWTWTSAESPTPNAHDGTSLTAYDVSGLTTGNIYLYKIQYTITSNPTNIALRWQNINFFDGGVTINSTVGTHIYYGFATSNDVGFRHLSGDGTIGISNISLKQVFGNFGRMTNQDSSDLVYSSVLPDQSFLGTGVNSAYNFIDLDGVDEYIETSDSADFDFGTGDFSISFWFNVNDIDWNWAVSRANSANSADLYIVQIVLIYIEQELIIVEKLYLEI
jgi:hypothetical protein